MAINIVHVVKNSLKISTAQAITLALGAPAIIYAATVIDPREYGDYGFLALWLMYANLVALGVSSAGAREIPVCIGRDQEDDALRIQNISMSSEMLYTCLPFTVIFVTAFFYSDTVLKLGLIIIAATYFVNRMATLWGQMIIIRERFNIVAKGRLLSAIIAPVIILTSVNWLGIYALLLGPLAASSALWIYYLAKGSLNFRFAFDWPETSRLVKIGIVLSLLNLAFWGFRLTDRTVIASMLTWEELGLYAYAIQFLLYMLILPENFGGVLQPILWREAGKSNSIGTGFSDTKRIAVYLSIGVCVLVPIAQLLYFLVVKLIITDYEESIPIFWVLSLNLYLASVSIIPNLILNSSVANRQNILLCFYVVGLVLNIIFDIIVIEFGHGIVGVAWVTICTQGLVTFVSYYFVKAYIFENSREFMDFMVRILLPFVLIAPSYFFHSYLDSEISNLGVYACISLASQAILWPIVIYVFYRNYLSISHIKELLENIKV